MSQLKFSFLGNVLLAITFFFDCTEKTQISDPCLEISLPSLVPGVLFK